ncbi:hypothetical protein HGG71_05105 [Rhodobacteraceae bacterium R_SAG2]|nr:hypothetical protein [Rhodobacteraceae bacterium R_SAG2]
MNALRIDTVVDALDTIAAYEGTDYFDYDQIEFGDAFGLDVYLPKGFDSELPWQYLDAYYNQRRELFRLVAMAENGSSDAKTLTSAQLARYDYRVKVEKGSSQIQDNLASILEKVLTEAAKNMTGEQVVLTIVGLAVVAGCSWGFQAYTQRRKEERLEEIQAEERRATIKDFNAASTDQVAAFTQVLEKMSEAGGPATVAAKTAEAIVESQLKAASQTNFSVIGGVELDKEIARELRAKPRRRAEVKRITKEMRVVDVNTADPIQSIIILEDLETELQSKISFSDRVVDAVFVDIVHDALRKRGTAIFRLEVKETQDDMRIVNIVSVEAAPEDTSQ